jgi:glycosyltransferase involved in cell wall biosynthesis
MFSSFGPEICGLLEEYAPALLQNPAVELMLVGPAERIADRLLRSLPNTSGRISAAGRVHVSEAGVHLRSCDVLLQVYPDGACSARGTLLAALASGVPVISTKGPLTDRLLIDSKAVFFTESDPGSIREAVESLRADPAMARGFGAQSRRLYEEHFDLPVTVSRLRQTVVGGAKLETEEAAVSPA